MGMTIEEAIKYYENKNVVLTEEEALANTLALNTMRKYQQLQADYENRLKADMVAMLENLDLQIDELTDYNFDNNFEVTQVQRLIRDKINSLKEDT